MKRFFTNRIFLVVFLFSTLWGCGSGDTGPSAGQCDLVVEADPNAVSELPLGFVVTSDFSVGNLTTLTTTTPRLSTPNVLGGEGLHPDSVIRTFENWVFIIQRLGADSVVVLDSKDPSVSVKNYSTNDPGPDSPQSDPHDMAFVDLSKAYITRYGQNDLLIVNPLTGERLGTVELSVFADSDGLVEMDQMVIVDGKLFVTLQRLDRNNFFAASNSSYMVVIDTATDQIIDVDDTTPEIDAIILEGRNPFGRIAYLSTTDRIYVSNASNFSIADEYGGIEAINPNTNTTDGIILTDNELGGPLGVMAILNETTAYITVFDESFNNLVVPFDFSARTVDTALACIGTSFIPSLAFDHNDMLYIADQDTNNPGIQVFDPSTNEKIEGPISTGLPPSGIAFITP